MDLIHMCSLPLGRRWVEIRIFHHFYYSRKLFAKTVHFYDEILIGILTRFFLFISRVTWQKRKSIQPCGGYSVTTCYQPEPFSLDMRVLNWPSLSYAPNVTSIWKFDLMNRQDMRNSGDWITTSLAAMTLDAILNFWIKKSRNSKMFQMQIDSSIWPYHQVYSKPWQSWSKPLVWVKSE